MFNKRGQTNTIAQIVGVVLAVFVILLIGLTAMNINQGFSSAFGTAFEEISNIVSNSIGPMFKVLLGTQQDANSQFLVILSFILISIIIVGTLDSVNIFGETKQGGLINFAVGIIVSIIGVRFMPQDLWISLTAPSSAFVATILVGAPFIALFFVTMKIKSSLFNKLLWLFYIIFMSYLIFFPGGVDAGLGGGASGRSSDFMYIYVFFLGGAVIMMIFDASVRQFIRSEQHKTDIVEVMAEMNAKERYKLRKDIARWQAIIADPTAPPTDKAEAAKQIAKIKKIYGDISKI